MLEKLLIICCYFDYHPKTKLVDVKIGFGPSGKIEKVECKICKKTYIQNNRNFNPKIIFIIVLLFILALLFF